MTMYFVAGGDGCDGVPGRGDIRVRELGTLMMLGVRGPADPLNPLCETVRVGRGCKTGSAYIIEQLCVILQCMYAFAQFMYSSKNFFIKY